MYFFKLNYFLTQNQKIPSCFLVCPLETYCSLQYRLSIYTHRVRLSYRLFFYGSYMDRIWFCWPISEDLTVFWIRGMDWCYQEEPKKKDLLEILKFHDYAMRHNVIIIINGSLQMQYFLKYISYIMNYLIICDFSHLLIFLYTY